MVAAGDSTCFTVGFSPLGEGPDTCSVTVVTGDSTAVVLVTVGSVTSVRAGDGMRPVVLSPVFPNPFTAATQVRFTLAAAGPVRLNVFDLRGRLVDEILRGEVFATGDHTVNWDGRDGTGQAVAAGIYLIRVQTPEASAVVRAVRTR
jgi:hypothetical protein